MSSAIRNSSAGPPQTIDIEKTAGAKTPLWPPFLISILCGVVMALPFRDYDGTLPAWIALAPMFRIVVYASRRRRALICGAVFSMTWTFLSFNFLWRQTPFGTIAVSLFTTLVYTCALLCVRRFARRTLESSILRTVLGIAAIWSLVEIVRSTLPILCFPWLLLGHTLLYSEHLRQGADLLGVYGLSFLIAAANAAFAFAIPNLRAAPSIDRNNVRGAWASVGLVAILTLALFGYGAMRIAQLEPLLQRGRPIGIVQGNTVQKLGRSSEELTAQLESHLALHRKLVAESKASANDTAGLICWAETMVPGVINEDGWAKIFKREIAAYGIPTLTGVNYQMERDPAFPDEVQYQNAGMLFDGKGNEVFHYCKRRLVPFGEYVPFNRWPGFSLLRSVTRDQYVPGTGASPVHKIGGYAIALNICVEDIHPDLAREAAGNGADTMINLTNDGWFYGTYGPRSHLQAAAWRAIEVRRPLLRVTNTGKTVAVNPLGVITEIIPEATEGSCLYGLERLTQPPKTLTMYLGELGEAAIFAAVLLGCIFMKSRNGGPKPQ